MKLHRMSLVACFLAVAGFAIADVVPLADEFPGDYFEGFENINPPGQYASYPIRSGQGTAISGFPYGPMMLIVLNHMGAGGEVLPYNGNLFGAVPIGSVIFLFNESVTEFGGYFSTVEATPGATIVFRDKNDAEIATLPMTCVPAVWTWQGWHSDTPIGSVEIIGVGAPPFSGALDFDDLRVTLASAPCSLPGDINGDGVVAGDDIDGFVRAKLGLPAAAGENQACADYGTGTLEGDLVMFIADLLAND